MGSSPSQLFRCSAPRCVTPSPPSPTNCPAPSARRPPAPKPKVRRSRHEGERQALPFSNFIGALRFRIRRFEKSFVSVFSDPGRRLNPQQPLDKRLPQLRKNGDFPCPSSSRTSKVLHSSNTASSSA